MPPADLPQLDVERILATIARHGVDHVLVGGLAVQTHGHLRTTFDVDIVPSPDPGNLEHLAAALRELEAQVLNPGGEELDVTAAMLPRAALWQFDTRHGPLDVLREAPGAPSYTELRERALEVELGDLRIVVAGLDDLISMKRARGRPVDLDDIAALTSAGPRGSP